MNGRAAARPYILPLKIRREKATKLNITAMLMYLTMVGCNLPKTMSLPFFSQIFLQDG